MHLIVLYLKLGILFGPLMYLYTLWDHRHHPVVMPDWEPTTAIEHIRGLVWFYLFWPIYLPFLVIGYVSAVIFYLSTGMWPP